jgi:hypothetical protein
MHDTSSTRLANNTKSIRSQTGERDADERRRARTGERDADERRRARTGEQDADER